MLLLLTWHIRSHSPSACRCRCSSSMPTTGCERVLAGAVAGVVVGMVAGVVAGGREMHAVAAMKQTWRSPQQPDKLVGSCSPHSPL